MKRKKRILVAPLDWGLGHASRCIPIINALQQAGAEVIIASSGRALQLLQAEFGSAEFYELPGYNIKYGKNFNASITRQLPKIAARVSWEHVILQRWLRSKKIDAVISDNRFGLWTKKKPCIFITHQVRIIIPEKLSIFERMVFFLNRSFISKFNELWVPDFEGENNLSGKLSHTISGYDKIHYLGPLSRLHSCSSTEKKYDVAVILSGPEPHRTELEKKITAQLINSIYKAIVVQGKTEHKKEWMIGDEIKVVSYLTGKELNDVICSSSVIISRSGYSTVMDIVATGAQAIFIPTPGQTEQEYLAEELKRKQFFYCESQDDFLLERALKESENYKGTLIVINAKILKDFIANWLNRI